MCIVELPRQGTCVVVWRILQRNFELYHSSVAKGEREILYKDSPNKMAVKH